MTIDELLDELTPPPTAENQLKYNVIVETANGVELEIDSVRWDHDDKQVAIETS